MIILGLDLGTKCGWAVLDDTGARRASGTWDLAVHRYDGAGMRYVMLEAHLNRLKDAYGPGDLLLAYEECVAVGATRYDEAVAYYSNRGAALDLTAPGGDVRVDQNGDGYGDGVLQQTFGNTTNSWGY